MNMDQKKNETRLKYLNALTELKNRCESGDKVMLSAFAKEKRLSASIGVVLIEGGIVKRTNNSCEWISIKPNIKMVDELLMRMAKKKRVSYTPPKDTEIKPNKPIKVTNIKKAASIKTPSNKVTKKVTIKKRNMTSRNNKMTNETSITFFWGLFKYRKVSS